MTWRPGRCAADLDGDGEMPEPVAPPHLALFDEQDWELVVYDEVHLLPAPVFRATARIQATRRLGLTATLVREDGRAHDVVSLIGPKRYDAPWRDLESQGRIAATTPRKLDVLDRLVARHTGDRVLIIGQYLDQLQQVADRVDAPPVTGRTGQATREERFAAFRDGDLPVLVASKVANFSIDLPEANVAIQLSGTFGSRQEEAQRHGRLLRPTANGDTAHFSTVASRDTIDQTYPAKRQRFLTEQRYSYRILDAEEVG